MAASKTVLDVDWLDVCRRATKGLRGVMESHPTTADRAVEAGGVGEGGDRTLVIDRAAEDVVFHELQTLHDAGHRFTLVSEERGNVDFGDPSVLVVVDPIDGSLNAKRGITHHALSIAVADGTTMADVVFGYVSDLGAREEWWASRGEGAFLDGERLELGEERRNRNGLLEVVGIESADPRWVAEAADDLRRTTHRLRAVGSIALSLCQVASGRFDAMVSLRRCRAFDAAAAQLVVREAGGEVAFCAFEDPLAAPLDLEPRSPVIAAATAAGVRELWSVPVADPARS
jgi:myo-inositol-1(or 4)-monophosphatase